MPRQRESLADVTAALARVDAAIDALMPRHDGRVFDLMEQGHSLADALKANAIEVRAALASYDHAELDRLHKLRDKLTSKRQRMTTREREAATREPWDTDD